MYKTMINEKNMGYNLLINYEIINNVLSILNKSNNIYNVVEI